MSNFTPLVEHEFEFQGDVVKTTYSRLKRNDMLKVLPLMKSLKDDSENQEVINEILELLIDSIPGYITTFSGLKDADGNNIEIETVVEEFYFLTLAAQIALQMIKDSSATAGNG